MADFVGVGRVVADHGGVGGCDQRRVTIHVLGALTGQGGAPSRGANDETTGELVAGSPELVGGALETEHRVEDVNRDHRLIVDREGGAGHLEGASGTSLVNTGVHDLTGLSFTVRQHHVCVYRQVVLAQGVEDLS